MFGLRNGELGALPIVIGLLIIAVVFQTLNSNFLTPGNFVNLMIQGSAMATIADAASQVTEIFSSGT